MAKDHDLISSQTHELNYLLKKWEKKQNKKNRQILRDTLKDFRADESYSPNTRENFYKYVDDHDILKLLEDIEQKKSTGKESIVPDVDMSDLTIDEPYMHKEGKKKTKKQKIKKQKIQIQDLTQFKNRKSAGKLPGQKAGKIKKAPAGGLKEGTKKKFILLLIIILIVVLIIVLIFVGTCMYKNAQAKKTDSSLQENVSEAIQPEEEEPAGKEKEDFTADTLKSFLKTCTPIYFIGDLDEFVKGEVRKIEKLALYLDNYARVELSVEGHTASTGQPENEMDLSIKRAGHVAEVLKNNIQKADLTVKTRGYGATREAKRNPQKEQMKLNRRVEIVVIEAE